MLVSVLWWDAYGVQQDWEEERDCMKKLASNLSVGLITYVRDDRITISPHLAGSGKDRMTCGDMIIPFCNIAGLQHLTTGEWIIDREDLQEMTWMSKGRYDEL